MSPRVRSFTTYHAKGRVVTNGVLVLGNHDKWASIGTASDHTGPGDCAPFGVTRKVIGGGRVNVINSPTNYWDNYEVDYLQFDSAFTHMGPPPGQDISNVQYATAAAARTNPSRPYVDVPVALLELGDVTRLLRSSGESYLGWGAKNLGNAHLANQFGIAPLVGDLHRLLSFQDQLERRISEVNKLGGSRGLRRTVSAGGWSNSETYSAVMQSNQAFWTDQVTRTTTESVRVHCRWLPTGPYASLSRPDRERLAFRSVLGLTVDHSTLWELIPWSWLIDWASNVGQYFQAQRNIIPATLSGVHVMRETQTEYTSRGVGFANGRMSPINAKVISKNRNPSFVAPIAHFPFLNGNQVGILASLAVTRT
jgi:hypothetical protein